MERSPGVLRSVLIGVCCVQDYGSKPAPVFMLVWEFFFFFLLLASSLNQSFIFYMDVYACFVFCICKNKYRASQYYVSIILLEQC